MTTSFGRRRDPAPSTVTISCGHRRAYLTGDGVLEVLAAAGLAVVRDEFGDVVVPVGAHAHITQVARRLGYRAILRSAGSR